MVKARIPAISKTGKGMSTFTMMMENLLKSYIFTMENSKKYENQKLSDFCFKVKKKECMVENAFLFIFKIKSDYLSDRGI